MIGSGAVHVSGAVSRVVMRVSMVGPVLLVVLAGCGGGGGSSPGSGPAPGPTPTPGPTATPAVYQPLAAGDSWAYTCHNTQNSGEAPYAIANTVVGTATVNGHAVYELSLQIPSSPTQSVTQIQLLADDAAGNTSIYGYLAGGVAQAVTPAVIVAANPSKSTPYDYPALGGGTVPRAFVGFESSNPTSLGTFQVAPYFESGGTHNYGYALGIGIVEEDHGPNFQYDCLVTSATVH